METKLKKFALFHEASVVEVLGTTFLRWSIIFGMFCHYYFIEVLRLDPGRSNYINLQLWLWSIGVLVFYAVVAFTMDGRYILGYRRRYLLETERRPPGEPRAFVPPKAWLSAEIILDTTMFSIVYLYSGDLYSVLFLFYFLPLFMTSRYFDTKKATLFFGYISAAFGFTLFFSQYFSPAAQSQDLPARVLHWAFVFGPRWIFLLILLVVLSRVFLRLEVKRQEIEAVRQTSFRIVAEETLESRLTAILQAATDLLKTRGAKVYLRNSEDEVQLVALVGISPQADFKVGDTFSLNEGLVGLVAAKKEPIIINNYRDFEQAISAVRDIIGTAAEVPLIFGDEFIGVLGVFDLAQDRRFNTEDIVLLERLGQHAAVAIHDAQLLENSKKQQDDLQVQKAALVALMGLPQNLWVEKAL
jgi:hypothetical protein